MNRHPLRSLRRLWARGPLTSLLELAGVGLIVVGVCLIYVPAGLIVAGMLAVLAGVLAG